MSSGKLCERQWKLGAATWALSTCWRHRTLETSQKRKFRVVLTPHMVHLKAFRGSSKWPSQVQENAQDFVRDVNTSAPLGRS